MAHLCALLILLTASSLTQADGPGTRIRSGSQLPQPAGFGQNDAFRHCAPMPAGEKERCLSEQARRESVEKATRKTTGAGSTGMGSGAVSAPR